MEIVHRPVASHQISDALIRRPCEREAEEIVCRQCRHPGKEKRGRTVRVMTRGKLLAKLDEKTTGIQNCR